MSSQQTSNAYPMASRILDMAHGQSMMTSIFGPRKFSQTELSTLAQEIFLLEGSLTRLASFAAELRHGPYDSSSPPKIFHNHLVPAADANLAFGLISIAGVELRSAVTTGAVPDKSTLLTPAPVVVNVANVPADILDEPETTEVYSSSHSPVVLTTAVTRLPSAIYNAMGSMLREIGATIYKGDCDTVLLSQLERAALMRLQDERVKQLCERAQHAATSDGEGAHHGAGVVEAQLVAEEIAVQILRSTVPTIYAWIFKGEAIGKRAYSVHSTSS